MVGSLEKRTMEGITFTGKPVKCLGIYIGHDNAKCLKMNWDHRLERLDKHINYLNKWNLSLNGKMVKW